MADQHLIAEDASRIKRKNWIPFTCPVCNKVVWLPPSRAKRRKHCSRKCTDKVLQERLLGIFGENSLGYKNGGFIDKKGYKQVLVSSPKDVKGGHRYKGEHVLIGERVLGRNLKKTECVHHIDCVSGNNGHDNLLVCDRGYHAWLHWEMSRRYGQEVLGGGSNRRSA